ncbi:MAG TPA: hypothetical protein VLY22_00080 [Candidatus Nitrosotalea sp.]|nr:hypothetical protein [Candidatus Nitrosotalea sp.]
MNRFSKLAVAAFVAVSAIPTLTAQTVKVGTFDRTSVAVAYYRSPQWTEVLKEKEIERQKAKQANNQERVKELEQWGGSAQELAHKQVAGEASIANIIEALRPTFPEVAAIAHVAMIVSGLEYTDGTVESVDVTDLLLDQLKATQATRQIVEEMRKQKKSPNSP